MRSARTFVIFVSAIALPAAAFAQATAKPAPTTKSATQSLAPPKDQASAEAQAAPASKLPVRRVILYKNGVGYFEHRAPSMATSKSTSTSPAGSSTTCCNP